MTPNTFRGYRLAVLARLSKFDDNGRARIALGVGLVLFIALLFPKGLSKYYEYSEGTIWNEEDLIAPFSYPIHRIPAVIDDEVHEATRATPLSFDRIDTVGRRAVDSLDVILSVIASVIDSTVPLRPGLDATSRAAPLVLRSIARRGLAVPLSSDDAMILLRLRLADRPRRGSTARPYGALRAFIMPLLDDLYTRGLLDRSRASFEQPTLALQNAEYEELHPVRDFLDRGDIDGFVRARAHSDVFPAPLVVALIRSVAAPNIVHNPRRSQVALQAATAAVPRTDGIVKQNERIVSRHERITPAIKAKLDSYQRARIERAGEVNTLLQVLGRAGHTATILSFLGIYLALFRKRIFRSTQKLLLLGLIILIPTMFAYLSFSVPISGPVQYLILVPIASMLVAIIFDSRVAFYTTVTVSFLVGALRGNDYTIILASAMAGSLALYTVRDIKHRTQIFRSLTFIFLGYAIVIGFDGLQRAVPMGQVTTDLLYAAANALLSSILTFGLLYFFERLFGIDTDLTLLELSDFNHPLLRELSSRAPGTFHHSIVMGTLAEAAALAIGANPILARVGAYYHDIGKCPHPEAFVENQLGTNNIHESLPPVESARRIIKHVEDGITMAREAGLPQRVIDFIPAHHGTTTVAYFLEKERQERPESLVAGEFRYPGPSPLTKETAIVMLADTIEAAARALEEPTVDSIEKLIDHTVNKRLAEGQLEYCDLTFRELMLVKKSFLTILTGIHHNRIKYPTEADAEAAQKNAERTAKLLKLPSTADAISSRIRRIDQL
ncbi:MAG: HDIG domain-containing protein [Ignavibacteriae bacterium]|nr:HDIG domain-containing protein [Ignavibacteriota bacterium]